MASSPSPAAGAAPPKKGASLVMQAGMLLALTLLVGGMGWFAGGQIAPGSEAPPASGGHGPASAAAGDHGEEHAAPGHPQIVALAPIHTNLAAPDDVWVRMEVALEFAEPPEPGVPDSVHQDLLAFIRTVKLHQVEGPSGILHLKADLDERAKLRSAGKASRVLIRTLLFE